MYVMYVCMYVVVIVFADLAFNFFDLLAPQNLENEEREGEKNIKPERPPKSATNKC